jgi:hypothetical protein
MADDRYILESRGIEHDRFSAVLSNVPILVQLFSLVGGVLGILVPGLGYLTHERRVLMLSVPRESLEYGPYQAALTGFSVCWHLPWQMAYALTSGPNWMMGISLAVLTVILLRTLAIRKIFRPSTKTLAVLLVLQITGVVTSLGYSQVITLERNEVPQALGRGGFSLIERARLQTRGWIENPTPATRARASALAGLSGWLTLFAVTMMLESQRLAAKSRGAVRFCFKACQGAFLVLSVFLCGQIPTAHAYAQWGFTYPSVVGVAAKCDADLAKSIKSGEADAWDISMGAKYEYLLVRNANLKQGKWFVQPLIRPGGGKCSSLAADEVIPPETTP